MRKIFAKTQKVELNSFINEFVKIKTEIFYIRIRNGLKQTCQKKKYM